MRRLKLKRTILIAWRRASLTIITRRFFFSVSAVSILFLLFQNCGTMNPTSSSTLSTTGNLTSGSLGLLSINPPSITLAPSASQTFTASGGSGSYSYSVYSGGGSINAGTGYYVAPSSSGTVMIKAYDNTYGSAAYASVFVSGSSSSITISPSTLTLAPYGTQTFSASGGSGYYQYSIYSGGGSITPSGYFEAPGTIGTTTIEVLDTTYSYAAYATVTISSTYSYISTPATVQYRAQDGSGTSIDQSLSAGVYPCSNTTFGADPSVGHVKGCYVSSVLLASENADITVSSYGTVTGESSVSFGAGNYNFIPTSADLCMGVTGASTSNGAQVVQWGCLAGHMDQFWNLVVSSAAINTFNIVDVNSGKYLAVSGASLSEGASVVQWSATGGNEQLWQFVPYGAGYQIKNLNSGQCLGVTGGSTSQGANLVQWACDESANQTWTVSL